MTDYFFGCKNDFSKKLNNTHFELTSNKITYITARFELTFIFLGPRESKFVVKKILPVGDNDKLGHDMFLCKDGNP